MITKAMIMAAGVGSRLHPLTCNVPKPLIPVANVPLMDLILQHLESQGIKEVIANTHYLAEQIQKRYVHENPTDVVFNYIFEQELSGTAGGVKKCEFFFDDSFFVLSADGLCDVDLCELFQAHKESGAIATMALYDASSLDISQFGVVVVDDGGYVKEFQEKPLASEAKSSLVNTGIYVFEPEIFSFIKENKFQDFAKNIFPYLLHRGVNIHAHKIDCYWNDIGTISQYQKSVKDFIAGAVNIDCPLSAGCVIDGGVVKKPSFISPKAKLLGYNSIGENCNIMAGAIVQNSVLFDDIIIEENSKIINSILISGKVKKYENCIDSIIFQENVNKMLL